MIAEFGNEWGGESLNLLIHLLFLLLSHSLQSSSSEFPLEMFWVYGCGLHLFLISLPEAHQKKIKFWNSLDFEIVHEKEKIYRYSPPACNRRKILQGAKHTLEWKATRIMKGGMRGVGFLLKICMCVTAGIPKQALYNKSKSCSKQ